MLFRSLGLQLPPNISFDGLVPYAKANEDGFDNEACKLRVWDEFRAEQLVTLECDEDTGAFEFIWLAFFIFFLVNTDFALPSVMSCLMNLSLSDSSSNHPTIYSY